MGITDIFHRKSEVGSHMTYGLTPLGKTKAEQYVATTPQSEVLACLNENGTCTVAEIGDEVKANPQKVKWILRGLIKSGYVRRVSQEG